MPGTVVECPSCSKKYRIPDGTLMAEFACKACGEMIPLDDEPPPTRRAARGGGDGEDGGRRGRRAAPQKSNTPMILIGAGIVVVIVVLIVAFGTGGDDDTPGAGGPGPGVADMGGDGGGPGAAPDQLKEPPPPQFTEYGGEDKTACDEVRKFWAAAPKKPKVKATAGGTIRREEWDRWQLAKKKHAEQLRQHFAKIAEMGKDFLAKYPGSPYEQEMGQATLMGQYKTDDYAAAVALADAYVGQYPKLKIVCLQVKGDSLDKLGRYVEASDVYGMYFDATTGKKAITAAKKYIATLIKAGKGSVAKEKAPVVLRTTPRARPAVEAMLRPLALIGKRLPATPGATPLFSDEPVKWSDYKGKVTLVLIWSNQYDEGEAAMRAAAKLARQISGDVPFQIIGVAMSEKDDEQKLDQWLNSNDLSDWPQVLQLGRYSKSPVLKAWGLAIGDEVCKIPTTFLLDRAGVVRYADVPVGKHMEKLIRGMR